jgi:hypothetical protein
MEVLMNRLTFSLLAVTCGVALSGAAFAGCGIKSSFSGLNSTNGVFEGISYNDVSGLVISQMSLPQPFQSIQLPRNAGFKLVSEDGNTCQFSPNNTSSITAGDITLKYEGAKLECNSSGGGNLSVSFSGNSPFTLNAPVKGVCKEPSHKNNNKKCTTVGPFHLCPNN